MHSRLALFIYSLPACTLLNRSQVHNSHIMLIACSIRRRHSVAILQLNYCLHQHEEGNCQGHGKHGSWVLFFYTFHSQCFSSPTDRMFNTLNQSGFGGTPMASMATSSSSGGGFKNVSSPTSLKRTMPSSVLSQEYSPSTTYRPLYSQS